jgi:glycosyltransferase involved in cell wall biosynthesis
MVTISCSGKFHAFALAEQMERNHMLDGFFTTYASARNTIARKFVKRTDRENISVASIHSNIPLAVLMKLQPAKAFTWNDRFDRWVAGRLKRSGSKIFIGWSGMSEHSIAAAKSMGMKTIVERGSSHIFFQNDILKEEYKKFGVGFSIDNRVIEKELKEYETADYISIPSFFVKKTFLDKGVKESRLLMNPYGASAFFTYKNTSPQPGKKFRIVYLGTLSVRKGLVYLFEALQMISLPEQAWEVWFIGNIEPGFRSVTEKYKKNNWTFFGHINHYELDPLLSKCDVGIQPSLEEGLSMVIPQMMSCGLPVIITPNSGGENMVEDGLNGFVVPIRDPAAIVDKIDYLINHPEKLQAMKLAAAEAIKNGFTWNNYGDRYVNNLTRILNE